eukprot:1433655-Prorocentrum_lima.AAC.1
MTSSLVGSEMCIRDSSLRVCAEAGACGSSIALLGTASSRTSLLRASCGHGRRRTEWRRATAC